MTSELFRNLRPFFLMFIIFGFMGCKVSSERLEKSRFWCLIWALFIAIFFGTISFVFSISDRVHCSGFLWCIRKYTNNRLSLLRLFGTLFFANYYQDLIIAFYLGAENYDNRVEFLGHKKKNGFWIIWLNFGIECTITFQRIYVYLYKPPIIKITTLMQLMLGDTERFMAFYMCLNLYLLLDRFRHLNNILIPKLFSKHSRQRESFVLCQIKYLHCTLFNMARDINTLYDFATIAWFQHVFIFISEFFYSVSFRKLPLRDYFSVLSRIFRFVYFVFLCDEVCKESSISGFRVAKERRRTANSPDTSVWLDTALYFQHHKVHFTTCNLFHLRLSTLLDIIGGSISFYLFIFIRD